MQKDLIKISGMHCTSCALTIDFELEDTEGVHEIKTDYARQHVDVEYDPHVISRAQIHHIIKKLGYDIV